jgi:hypothetical protein
MRIVADTNTLVSGFGWGGPPDEITTQAGPKFATKQTQTGASSGDHTQNYTAPEFTHSGRRRFSTQIST